MFFDSEGFISNKVRRQWENGKTYDIDNSFYNEVQEHITPGSQIYFTGSDLGFEPNGYIGCQVTEMTASYETPTGSAEPIDTGTYLVMLFRVDKKDKSIDIDSFRLEQGKRSPLARFKGTHHPPKLIPTKILELATEKYPECREDVISKYYGSEGQLVICPICSTIIGFDIFQCSCCGNKIGI